MNLSNYDLSRIVCEPSITSSGPDVVVSDWRTMSFPGQQGQSQIHRIEIANGAGLIELEWMGDHVGLRVVSPTIKPTDLPALVNDQRLRVAVDEFVRSHGVNPQSVSKDISISIDWPREK